MTNENNKIERIYSEMIQIPYSEEFLKKYNEFCYEINKITKSENNKVNEKYENNDLWGYLNYKIIPIINKLKKENSIELDEKELYSINKLKKQSIDIYLYSEDGIDSSFESWNKEINKWMENFLKKLPDNSLNKEIVKKFDLSNLYRNLEYLHKNKDELENKNKSNLEILNKFNLYPEIQTYIEYMETEIDFVDQISYNTRKYEIIEKNKNNFEKMKDIAHRCYKEINIDLSKYVISYNRKEAKLVIGDLGEINFTYDSNQHEILDLMCGYNVLERIDWSKIYEETQGIKPSSINRTTESQKRSIRDTVRAINKKIRDTLNIEYDLIESKNNTYYRKY